MKKMSILDITKISEIANISEETSNSLTTIAETIGETIKDLPEAAKIAVVSAIAGGALVCAGVYMAKSIISVAPIQTKNSE